MPVKRIVTVDDATGNVLSDWRGGDEQTLEPVAGRTHLDVANDDTDYTGQRWNGTSFELVPKPPSPPVVARLTVANDLEVATTIAGVKTALLPYFKAGGS